jgi:hypothetical protein
LPQITVNISDEDYALLDETATKLGEPVAEFFKKRILAELNAETDGLVTLDRLEELALGQRLIAAKIAEAFKEIVYDLESQKETNSENSPVRIFNVVNARAGGLWSSTVDAVQDYLIGNGVDPLGLDDL